MPGSSGTPGHDPLHHLDLLGILSQTEGGLSCLGLELTGCLGLLTESWWSLREFSATNVPLRQRRPPAFKALSQQECITSRLKEVILPILSIGETHLQSCLQLWTPQCKKDMDVLKRVQQRAIRMIKSLIKDMMEHPSYEQRLRQLGVFSLEKKGSGEILLMYINA